MAQLTCTAPNGSFVTDVRVNEYPQFVPGKYNKMLDTRFGVYVRCSMSAKSGNGKPCKYYAHGRVNGAPVCSGHFPPLVIKLKVCKEVECPVCMEEFVATQSSLCGHKVCSSCCRQMRDSGRTMTCPLCRDVRFKLFAELTCM